MEVHDAIIQKMTRLSKSQDATSRALQKMPKVVTEELCKLLSSVEASMSMDPLFDQNTNTAELSEEVKEIRRNRDEEAILMFTNGFNPLNTTVAEIQKEGKENGKVARDLQAEIKTLSKEVGSLPRKDQNANKAGELSEEVQEIRRNRDEVQQVVLVLTNGLKQLNTNVAKIQKKGKDNGKFVRDLQAEIQRLSKEVVALPSKAHNSHAGKLRFRIFNCGELKKNVYLESSATVIRNMPWHISAELKDSNGFVYLAIFVYCNGMPQSNTWSIYAKVNIKIINEDGCTLLGKSFSQLFTSESSVWGHPAYLLWKEALQADEGYIKDDCILLEVDVETFDV